MHTRSICFAVAVLLLAPSAALHAAERAASPKAVAMLKDEQARYTKVYQATVNELDTRGIGGIKAWFCGARKPIPVPGTTNWMTWAIFSDPSPAGRVERKYITDVMVRPRPLVVAGQLQHYATDFATLAFEMTLNVSTRGRLRSAPPTSSSVGGCFWSRIPCAISSARRFCKTQSHGCASLALVFT